jgi:hypothetical protein
MAKRIPILYVPIFSEFSGVTGIFDSPYPGEAKRGKFKDSWVIFEPGLEGYYTVFVTRSEYKEEFDGLVNDFNQMLVEYIKAESSGAEETPK